MLKANRLVPHSSYRAMGDDLYILRLYESRPGEAVTSFTLRAMPCVDGDLRVDVLLLDVTDLDSVSNMLAAAEPFQILVNNAGTNRPKPMVEASPEDFDVIMNLSVRSAFFVAQGVAKRLLPTGLPGSIINVSSQMGHVGRKAIGLLRQQMGDGGTRPRHGDRTCS